MYVVATAGHVDHGKSALVRALTGMEPDRWAEERRRGMTIDLGFAWTPSADGGHIAFVDVPGHERLVGNMLAGVGPVPAVLLVVAADQGWQPQSEEHLSVLHALGVRHGVLAVSRSDLADPAAVRDDALARVAATSLGEVEAVPVSAVTGQGLAELRSALDRMTASLPAPDTEADVRLWVDRAFTVRGRGTVATGTLGAGTLRVGDRLTVAGAGGRQVRVRGMQSLKEDRTEVGAVARVAVNLHGDTGGLGRGCALLTPERWLTTDVADVRLHGDPAAELPRRLTFHFGSAAVEAGVRPIGDDTARLTLAAELPLRIGDRGLVRDPGLRRVAAGITVLDVRPPRFTRRGAARTRARELAAMTGTPEPAAELRRRGVLTRTELAAMGAPLAAEPVAGDWLADPGHWTELRKQLAAAVQDHARRNPLDPGMPAEAARRALGLPDRLLVDALVTARGEPALHRRDGRLHSGAARAELPEAVRRAVDAVHAELAERPYRSPEAGRLAELGLTQKALAAAAAAGVLLKVADGIVLLPGADARAARLLAGLEQPFTLSQARIALDTTRRVAVPLLEHLDRKGHTLRVDETRRRCAEPRQDGQEPR
ncbi:selenocysteine-specific translation elongation factor [Streptomyces montanisoli]|uniref:Selenocysteine-specific translation elongation factor n=1 Tax=Streptomyces montanisoli TaxID=2798581 RepID=A0A940MLF5_9ACTN|nr:selenocysteine-specific translation elongation factor [Streptomyces montanisoli]MBP0461551.1 selenocysteine-specific translation elongation factor [Streptomyces montanisoli]